MNQIAKTSAESDYGVNISGMPMGLAIMFNDKLYERVKQMAKIMAEGRGFTPEHLVGKTEACFAVVTRAITWRLDPQAVAGSTYQTPGGRIGYEGKLIQAILENSGRLEGPVDYQLIGDWDKINGNFEIKKSEKGKDYAVPKWTRNDAKAGKCGVIISAQIKGEAERRVLKFMLDECFPLNSTLWATRPSQQIKYTGCRAFANTVAPGIMMGEPFDIDPMAGDQIKDITPKPRPRREEFVDVAHDENGEILDDTESVADAARAADEAKPAGDGVAPEPSAGDAEDEEGDPAYNEGWFAFEEGKPLMSPPENFNADEAARYKDGWRASEMASKAKAKA